MFTSANLVVTNYKIQRIFQEETFPPRLVCLATVDDQKFILKYIHPVNFEDLQSIDNRLRGANHVRLSQDTIPEKSMFVFEYFADHLLHLTQKDLPLEVIKRILRDALRGIAELHDRDIVHTDSKADNVFIDWRDHHGKIKLERVQLGDLEDAVHIPPESHMIGKQAGNWMWRSPEAHANGPVNKPSDIFSFVLVCIFALHKRVIFAAGEEELEEGIDPPGHYEDGLNSFLKRLGNEIPWVRVFEVLRDGFNKENPRRPFSLWKGVDNDFKSLICAMTNFDPERRITAHGALAHKWFEGI
ncbi:uncharacterized protein ASPGLDRAFT_64598 [Aspergillus glaucus CBS 516.65]|uniref:non-specific serine/threonine protein kinase n=1 Tax=Aspergillus glaucus CBS 516.65 TaxID=1160497 RepID=A0A1L9VUC6_ASPGL|nr:hypothetical protein ASPGLDRAFT_64598 [Aspergillus glaucus CBS 516.65]OJJ87487.1 hypothetical protein ASPGLDRAFT_64598 [Aspergillus glaucus CBS 516.65]